MNKYIKICLFPVIIMTIISSDIYSLPFFRSISKKTHETPEKVFNDIKDHVNSCSETMNERCDTILNETSNLFTNAQHNVVSATYAFIIELQKLFYSLDKINTIYNDIKEDIFKNLDVIKIIINSLNKSYVDVINKILKEYNAYKTKISRFLKTNAIQQQCDLKQFKTFCNNLEKMVVTALKSNNDKFIKLQTKWEDSLKNANNKT